MPRGRDGWWLVIVFCTGCGGSVASDGEQPDGSPDGPAGDITILDGKVDTATASEVAEAGDAAKADGDGGCSFSTAGRECLACAASNCCPELTACQADPKCAAVMHPFFDCLAAASADGGEVAADACDTKFEAAAGGSVAAPLVTCVHDSFCKTVCF